MKVVAPSLTSCVGFHGADVLNLGVSPALLVERALARFLAAGGVVKQETGVSGITVHPDMAVLHVQKTGHK